MEALGGEQKKLGKIPKGLRENFLVILWKIEGGPAAVGLARWEGFGESKLRLDGGLSELSEDELIALIRRPETLRSQQQAV